MSLSVSTHGGRDLLVVCTSSCTVISSARPCFQVFTVARPAVTFQPKIGHCKHTLNIPNCQLTTAPAHWPKCSVRPNVKWLHPTLHFLLPILTTARHVCVASATVHRAAEKLKQHRAETKLLLQLQLALMLSFSSFKYNKREDCLCLILLLIGFCSSSFLRRWSQGEFSMYLCCCQIWYSGTVPYFKWKKPLLFNWGEK